MLRERSGHALSLSGHDPAGSVSKKRRHFGPNPEMESRTVSAEKQFSRRHLCADTCIGQDRTFSSGSFASKATVHFCFISFYFFLHHFLLL